MNVASTFMGFAAILLWSTSIAFLRSVAEKNGALNTAFYNLLLSSLFLFLLQWVVYKNELSSKIKAIPFSYYYKVGTFMALYQALLYWAVGNADSREAVIVVGIINYLWPGLTFLFSIPILKNKARYSLLIPGILVAFIGTAVAVLEGNRLAPDRLTSSLRNNMLPFFFALLGAIAWGIYSNITRKYMIKEDIAATPVLFFISSVFILFIQIVKGEIPTLHLNGPDHWEFAYLVIFPTALAYMFWDRAMKRGNKNLVASFSYGIPLVSTFISCYYLNVRIGIGMGVAVVLVIIGAILCKQGGGTVSPPVSGRSAI